MHKQAGVNMSIGGTCENRLSSQADQSDIRFRGTHQRAVPREPQPAVCRDVHIVRTQMDRHHSTQLGILGAQIQSIPANPTEKPLKALSSWPYRRRQSSQHAIWWPAVLREGRFANFSPLRLTPSKLPFRVPYSAFR